jgi:hypothetical protein
LSDKTTPDPHTWDKQIERVERLLIFAHRPAHNASGLYRHNDDDIENLHVFNWGERGALLPEVSGLRLSMRFAVIPGYAPTASPRNRSNFPLTPTLDYLTKCRDC